MTPSFQRLSQALSSLPPSVLSSNYAWERGCIKLYKDKVCRDEVFGKGQLKKYEIREKVS